MSSDKRILYLEVSGCHECLYNDEGYAECAANGPPPALEGERIETCNVKHIPKECPLPAARPDTAALSQLKEYNCDNCTVIYSKQKYYKIEDVKDLLSALPGAPTDNSASTPCSRWEPGARCKCQLFTACSSVQCQLSAQRI